MKKVPSLLLRYRIKAIKNIRTFAAGLNQGGQRDAVTLLFYLKAK